jgi:probable HAF family extracellular repeat protein
MSDLGIVGYANAIAPNGRIVGFALNPVTGRPQAAVYEDGVLTLLQTPEVPAPIESYANDVSPRGQVVGEVLTGTTGFGVVWEDGVPTLLLGYGDGGTVARAINAAGDIVGAAPVPGAAGHAVMWRRGEVLVDLGTLPGGLTSDAHGINARRQVVGCSQIPEGTVAFFWDKGVMISLGTLGGAASCATAVNDRGQVVGWSQTASGFTHGFLWENGVMTDLGTLAAQTGSYATDINNRGQVVGYSEVSGPFYHAFLWENGVMTDLGGGTFSLANGVTESGQVVGRIDADWAKWTVR